MTKPQSPNPFHPAVWSWFQRTFDAPTPAQREAWPAIQEGTHTLIAAPTGSGKTLAAFLAGIDMLVRQSVEGRLDDATLVLYVSPLKALSNDVQKNLQEPLNGIADELNAMGIPDPGIRSQVRTGDTPQVERSRMRRKAPHILVTTPESLFILLTSTSGRNMLGSVRTVIIDEIHALAGNKRGAHLALSLERLGALTGQPPVRIGLSATQRPIEETARFLTGNCDDACTIIDCGHVRDRDLALELPSSPLEAVMAAEVWSEVYDRLAQLSREHRTTLIFVNTRRLAERAARHLGERLGVESVAAHHGSLAREHRLDAEQRLKHGRLKALVATSSLELGIDIGDVDLVCQLGSPRSISALLQRAGRARHQVGGIPKARLFPLSRDDLVECAALLDAVRRDELDMLHIPPAPRDVLCQQIIAEAGCTAWSEDRMYHSFTRAWPYRHMSRPQFDRVITMLAEGFSTRRGRRSRHLQRDAVQGRIRGRPGAQLMAVTNAGAIPDQFDYDVVLEPDNHFIGTVNEDFAFESLPGDIFQLGNKSYRVRKVETGKLRVEDAHGLPPNIPFWMGEAPGRTDELSAAVSRLREGLERELDQGVEAAGLWLRDRVGLNADAAGQLAEYLAQARTALGRLPTQQDLVMERFFDEVGDQHLVIHSPFGSRLNRAWGLGLRKRFCRRFNFELQAAALEDSIVISLGPTHSFPLEEVTRYLQSSTVREIVIQALLAIPMFTTHWRWNATIALAIRRNNKGRRVPPQFQRMDAEDLIAVVFPDQLACQDNLTGEREVPDHPLVNQTIEDCLHQVMDIEGLERLLSGVESGAVRIHTLDLSTPSPLAREILSARPYAFLDDAPAEERRTQAVSARRFEDPATASDLGRLDPKAIEQVTGEAQPAIGCADDLHDALIMSGFMCVSHIGVQAREWRSYLEQLGREQRACTVRVGEDEFWVAAERLPQVMAVFDGARAHPAIAGAGPAATVEWSRDNALIELLRAWLELSGPVSESGLQTVFHCKDTELAAALAALEQQGYCMRGNFTGTGANEWCERALLARMHRYTLQSLRREIQPVAAADYMSFLFQWHRVGTESGRGEAALLRAIEQLEGFPLPAGAWEADILPARVDDYLSSMLDGLCGTGQVLWARPLTDRIRSRKGDGRASGAGLLRATSIILINREQAGFWLNCDAALSSGDAGLSAAAGRVLDQLRGHGASFFLDIVRQTGLLRTQAEDALAELAARGMISSDSFAGLRALMAPASKRPGFARRRRRGAAAPPVDAAGRWALLNPDSRTAPEDAPSGWLRTPLPILEHHARVLLGRYGVVFRKVLERESLLPPWRELLYVLRRMEARGDVRGGRFVDGFSGEQFALPDAVAQLRAGRYRNNDEYVALSAADPLNLTGVILPGPRIPAAVSSRIVFRRGLPVAFQSGGDIEFTAELDNEAAWRVRELFARRRNPAGYFTTPTRTI